MKSLCVALIILTACLAGRGQSSLADLGDHAAGNTSPVTYLYPEQVTVPAGKATQIILHFRIKNGLHINSHTPHTQELIPTVFSIPPESGVKLEQALYPNGTEIALAEEPDHKLNVYTGEFAIRAQIVAQSGNHLVEATLRFQACTLNTCMPPRTIPVVIDVRAATSF